MAARKVQPTFVLAILAASLLAGCMQQGQPVVAERSPEFETPSRSSKGKAPIHRQSTDRKPIVHARTSPEVATRTPPPAKSRRVPGTYQVRKGDTLYSIAWRFELNPKALAQLNAIAPPYTIYPGQKLLLRGKPRATTAKPAAAAKQPQPPQPPEPPSRQGAREWVWPVASSPVQEFSRNSKGMDFDVPRGQPIRAVSGGQVVYAGNGIGGFEDLIILRHRDDLLSAYSFNGDATVAEQQRVKAGQKLADIKKSGRASQKLHFELRRDGTPINPRSLLLK